MNTPPNQKLVIAIDGPAGSGKSTTARALARRLNYIYLDTGAMYRAFTLKVLREGIDLQDEEALSRLARQTDIHLKPTEDNLRVFLDGEDVTERIRTPEIDRAISLVSRVKGVRERMVELQRELGKRGGIVAEGRDIGTVVFPQADLKIFLVATPEARARRRLKDLKAQGIEASLEEVLADIQRRDALDSTRAVSPLKKADDAVELDTSSLTIPQQVEAILKLVEEKRKEKTRKPKT